MLAQTDQENVLMTMTGACCFSFNSLYYN